MPAYQRAEILEEVARLIVRDRDEIAKIIVLEAGKAWRTRENHNFFQPPQISHSSLNEYLKGFFVCRN
jgi:hypothetical protein